jgi:hypothetical protein
MPEFSVNFISSFSAAYCTFSRGSAIGVNNKIKLKNHIHFSPGKEEYSSAEINTVGEFLEQIK